jgi:hypothetical protein
MVHGGNLLRSEDGGFATYECKSSRDVQWSDPQWSRSGQTEVCRIREIMLLGRQLNAANERIKLLEAVTNDPHALWANWLRGTVTLPVGIGDVRQYQERIKRLEEALDLVRPHCSFVHHSKKHQHAYNEPCPVVGLIEKAKEAKL